MRYIKFRGLCLETGNWVYGSLLNYDPCPVIQITELREDAYDYDEWEVDAETIGQFTGLKDVKGREIFEGDLVSFGETYWDKGGFPNIMEVVFDEDSASFRIYDYLELQGSSLAEKWFLNDMSDTTEVIGNIHTNKELLNYL